MPSYVELAALTTGGICLVVRNPNGAPIAFVNGDNGSYILVKPMPAFPLTFSVLGFIICKTNCLPVYKSPFGDNKNLPIRLASLAIAVGDGRPIIFVIF